MQDERTCTKCGATKMQGEFYALNSGRDGLMAECKECTKQRSRISGARRRAERAEARAVEAARLLALSHKRCSVCGEDKPFDAFYAEPRCHDGLSPGCKACKRAYTNARERARRAIHGPRPASPQQSAKRAALYDLAYSFKSAPCADCGTQYPPQIMHFHHVGPEPKLRDIAGLIRRYVTQEVLRAEIAKCVVLCPNCHALRHLRQREKGD